MKPLPSKLVCGLSTRVSLTEFDELSELAYPSGEDRGESKDGT